MSAGSTNTVGTAFCKALSWWTLHDLVHVLEAGNHALDDDELLGGGRVIDEHLQHEPVDLRLGQRVGPVGLDRVLRRHHQERVGQRVGLAADGDLALLHGLEQRALDLGRGTVDLVGQDQVGEDRTERHLELAELLVVDPRARRCRPARGPA